MVRHLAPLELEVRSGEAAVESALERSFDLADGHPCEFALEHQFGSRGRLAARVDVFESAVVQGDGGVEGSVVVSRVGLFLQ